MIAANGCLCWTILTLSLSTAVRAETDSKVQKLHYQGKIAYEKQDYDAAIAALNEALRLDPKHSPSYIGKGCAYRMKHDFERAIADYGEAIRLLSEDPRMYDDRGFAGAPLAYRQALYLRWLLAKAYVNRADAYAEKHDFERAIGDLTKAISLEPRDWNLYRQRANVHGLRKDYSRAMADCDYLVLLAPGQADSYIWRGTLYLRLEDYEHGIADLNEAIRRHPKYAQAFYCRGMAYLSQQDYTRAIADLEQTVRLDPQHSQACFALAQVFSKCPKVELRDPQKALEYAHKGCGAAEWTKDGYEITTRRFSLPLQIRSDRRADIAKIRLFVSDDKGKTWKHEKDYTPSDDRIIFTALHDGPYWFAVQVVSKDGEGKPADLDHFVPAMKVYVNSVGRILKIQKSCEEDAREVEQLRKTAEQLEKKVKELESVGSPK